MGPNKSLIVELTVRVQLPVLRVCYVENALL